VTAAPGLIAHDEYFSQPVHPLETVVAYGTALASYDVEEFTSERAVPLTDGEIEEPSPRAS
jgi:hypothetical protein